MSIRPLIRGLDLQKLKNIFGSKEPETIEGLKSLFDERYKEGYDKEEVVEVHSFIKKAVLGKISPEEAEEELCIKFPFLMGNVFAWYEQDLVWPETDSWAASFENCLYEVTRKTAKQPIREDIKNLINYIFTGRGLFSENIYTEDTRYAYLKNKELEKLLNYIDENEELFYNKGWKKELHAWLKNICKEKKDLFYTCA